MSKAQAAVAVAATTVVLSNTASAADIDYSTMISEVISTGAVAATTEEEQPADEPEDKPDEDIAASSCSGEKCDGPACKKLYEKSKDSKESKLDSYAERVGEIPLFAAVSGCFTVSANAGCPVWETPVNFDVHGASFSYDLVFDFHCQGWFTSVASYASVVMMIVCSFLAFRQALLD